MGKGKAGVEGWVAVVKPGRVMFEMAGPAPEVAKAAMRLAQYKLPIKTKFVVKEGFVYVPPTKAERAAIEAANNMDVPETTHTEAEGAAPTEE